MRTSPAFPPTNPAYTSSPPPASHSRVRATPRRAHFSAPSPNSQHSQTTATQALTPPPPRTHFTPQALAKAHPHNSLRHTRTLKTPHNKKHTHTTSRSTGNLLAQSRAGFRANAPLYKHHTPSRAPPTLASHARAAAATPRHATPRRSPHIRTGQLPLLRGCAQLETPHLCFKHHKTGRSALVARHAPTLSATHPPGGGTHRVRQPPTGLDRSDTRQQPQTHAHTPACAPTPLVTTP